MREALTAREIAVRMFGARRVGSALRFKPIKFMGAAGAGTGIVTGLVGTAIV